MTQGQKIAPIAYERYREWALRNGGPVPFASLERLVIRFELEETDLPWLSCFKIAHAAYQEGLR